MPRGRRKERGGITTALRTAAPVRNSSQDSCCTEGPQRREKESKLSGSLEQETTTHQHNISVFDSFFRFSTNFGRATSSASTTTPPTSDSPLPNPALAVPTPMDASPVRAGPPSLLPCSAPSPCARSSSSNSSDSSTGTMPVLTPEVPLKSAAAAGQEGRLLAAPPPLLPLGGSNNQRRGVQQRVANAGGYEEEEGPSDQASDRSEGDSGKENDVEDIPWRGSRSSLNSRSSRASRPRSGPFSELNEANIFAPSSSAASTGLQQDKKVVGLTEQQQTVGARVTRSTRRNGANTTSATVTNTARSAAVAPLSTSKSVSVGGSEKAASILTVAAADCASSLSLSVSTPPPVSPLKLVSATAGSGGLNSPLSPHKIQLQQRHSTLAEKFRNAISSSSSKSPKTPSPSTKKGSQSRQATANRKPGDSKPAGGRTKAEKLAAAGEGSRQITDFFPIRRSERKPKSELDKDKMENIEAQLLAPTDDAELGLAIRDIPNKGRGVVSTRPFKKGEFVVEYAGELIDIGAAKDREAQYSLDTSKGCYMYYFAHREKQYCIDATTESGRYGRLLNHSCKTPNCITKVVMLGDTPRLILVAKQDIPPDTELLYDYGDRSKESLLAHPWLTL